MHAHGVRDQLDGIAARQYRRSKTSFDTPSSRPCDDDGVKYPPLEPFNDVMLAEGTSPFLKDQDDGWAAALQVPKSGFVAILCPWKFPGPVRTVKIGFDVCQHRTFGLVTEVTYRSSYPIGKQLS